MSEIGTSSLERESQSRHACPTVVAEKYVTGTAPTGELTEEKREEENERTRMCNNLFSVIDDYGKSSFDFCGNTMNVRKNFESATVGTTETSDVCGCYVSARMMEIAGGTLTNSGASLNQCRMEARDAVCKNNMNYYAKVKGVDDDMVGLKARAKNIKQCYCSLLQQCQQRQQTKMHLLQRIDDDSDVGVMK